MPLATQTIEAGQQTTLHANPVDAGNNPAVPFNGPTYSVDLPSLVTLTPSADKSTCVCAAVGPLGTATVTIHGQAVNFGPDITTQAEIVIVAGPLDHFDPTFDPPVAKS